MAQNDAELIQRILQGDEAAFNPLVNKYQKPVHALAWRKVGDFHIAQEITQDAFLKAYQKLGTLKNHHAFAGWLYVIVARLSRDWIRKNRLPTESLDTIDASEVEHVSYSRYVAERQAAEADETRREVVKKLLQKLPESERTVVTLHYLGEMTVKAIAEFLGVSPNTVKSRLNRARNRLKKEEDMIHQNLGSFQLPTTLTENIMQEVSRIVPAAPTANKPVLPWALSAASAVLIFLLISVGTQHLSRFQKPYNLNATSEPTVEIIEALFVYDSPAKPAVRNQVGSSATPGKSPGAGQAPDAKLFAAARVDETEVSTPQPQWTRTKGPEGGTVNNLFTTLSGDVYAGTPASLYKLTEDARAWKHVNTWSASATNFQDWLAGSIQLAEYDNTIYLATDTEILAFTDTGDTWKSLGPHPNGVPRGFAVTDTGFYIAFIQDIYFSEEGQTSWVSIKNDLAFEKIRALVAVENTVFVGTDTGLYRLNAETWEQLSVGPADKQEQKLTIHALAASEHRLYVAAGWEFTKQVGGRTALMTSANWWSLYRSTDLGETWYAIDPRKKTENERENKGGFSIKFPLLDANAKPVDFTYGNIKIITNKAKVMVAEPKELFYSVNAGETWTALDLKHVLTVESNIAPPIVMLDANTFYIGGQMIGTSRTDDAGKSWQAFNTGLADAAVMKVFSTNGILHAYGMFGFATSTDGGESWTPYTDDNTDGLGLTSIVVLGTFNRTLYVKGMAGMTPQIRRLSIEDKKFSLIQGIPMVLEKPVPQKAEPLNNDLTNQIDRKSGKVVLDALRDAANQDLESGKAPNFEDIDFEQMNEDMNNAIVEVAAATMANLGGSFAVSGETYYIEYKQKLFRWKPGTDAWYNTGIVDSAENVFAILMSKPFDYSAGFSAMANMFDDMGFKIAVSGETVYVGKRDGHLAQSFDEGDTWNDVTSDLPFPFETFNALTFAGATVYVATDSGVAYSSDGTDWHTATDAEGNPLVIEQFSVAETAVYGIAGRHVYQLKAGSDTWKQVTPEIPDDVLSFAVDANVLYVGTASSGVLRFTLDK